MTKDILNSTKLAQALLDQSSTKIVKEAGVYTKNLYDLLENAVDQARSLELFFRGTVNHQLVSGSILIDCGNVYRFSLDRHMGRSALKLLPRIEPVMVVGLPLEKKLTVEDADTPKAEEVLHTLKAMMLEQSGITASGTSASLVPQIEKIVQDVLGKSANGHLNKIAQQYSPHEKPVEFLQECQNLIASMIGQDAAKRMFAPLFSKV